MEPADAVSTMVAAVVLADERVVADDRESVSRLSRREQVRVRVGSDGFVARDCPNKLRASPALSSYSRRRRRRRRRTRPLPTL